MSFCCFSCGPSIIVNVAQLESTNLKVKDVSVCSWALSGFYCHRVMGGGMSTCKILPNVLHLLPEHSMALINAIIFYSVSSVSRMAG